MGVLRGYGFFRALGSPPRPEDADHGAIACVLLVLIAKEMRKLVMRREDYYDDE